jgi:DnaJ domain
MKGQANIIKASVVISNLCLWVICISSLPVCHCFLHYDRPPRCIQAAASTTNPGRPSADQENGQPPNLYQILGASPKDTDQELKRKWQQLAKRLHPDANVIYRQQQAKAMEEATFNDSSLLMQPLLFKESSPYDLSDINAAWVVLGDPKERRKYDRALQAQEFADTFEILLDAGIKTAIPFLRKTANTTMEAAKQSTKVINDVNKRMTVAAAIFDLETEARELDRK